MPNMCDPPLRQKVISAFKNMLITTHLQEEVHEEVQKFLALEKEKTAEINDDMKNCGLKEEIEILLSSSSTFPPEERVAIFTHLLELRASDVLDAFVKDLGRFRELLTFNTSTVLKCSYKTLF